MPVFAFARRACCAAFLLVPLAAQTPYRPALSGPSKEAELALRKFVLPPDLTASLWAAEPQLGNPVAFWIDGRQRVYVAETFRLHKGVTDNRKFGGDWLEAELACRTVADRIAMYERFFKDRLPELTREPERVRLLWDADGDGRADQDRVFADSFKRLEDGIAAGLLEHQGDVFYTCIPKLWRLRDRDGDGVAEEQTALHDGFGVHTALLGHDMHGLILGPDGRLYFSIGDRGLSVTTPEGKLDLPDEGAVLRCELDGSGLEVFHRGLRNPQELAFDDFGNLFTGDNNSDGGDRARFVYLMPGGDCGWRCGFQSISDRGPWNQEKLWWPPFRGQAAYVNPPIDNYTSGPSGLVFDPGTGLPERWRGHFLLCDFRGSSSSSGVFALKLEAKGAGFELGSQGPVVTSLLATDVDIGPDGAIWVLDWTEGWDQPMKGRIYRLTPKGDPDPRVAQVEARLREGFAGLPDVALLELLGHADRRLRQGAQFELAKRDAALAPLTELAGNVTAPRLARVHAIWAVGQRARRGAAALLQPLLRLADDSDLELRAQLARVCGEARYGEAREMLTKLLRDRSSRVRSLAALALGRLGSKEAVAGLLRLLRENDDRDPWLRHAGVMGLAGCADAASLMSHASDERESVRLAVCLALRQQGSAEIGRLLADRSPLVAAEAARAIHDLPIAGATAALAAALAGDVRRDPALLRRALAANFRVGDQASAERVAAFAAHAEADDALRVLALDSLARWAHPAARDRVLDLWRPIPDRGGEAAAAALRGQFAALLAGKRDDVLAAAAQAAGALALVEFAGSLSGVAVDAARGANARGAALAALEKLDAAGAVTAAASLARSDQAALRKTAMQVVNRLDPSAAVAVLDSLVGSAPIDERQNALRALGDSKVEAADAALQRWLEVAMAGKLAPELRLDLLEAAGKRKGAGLLQKLAEHEQQRDPKDPLALWREALVGGDAKNGERLFWNHEAAVCTRCHALSDSGGNAGPPLDHIAERLTREQLLEALVLPQARVAEGFGTAVVVKKDGSSVAGLLKGDDGKVVKVQTPEGEIVSVPADAIAQTTPPVSAMPPMAAILDKRALRDLVEFLSQRRREPGKSEAATKGH